MSDHDIEDDAPEPEKSAGKGEGEEYKVGYGKPPKEHQFKTGNPGGPGKPKGSKNLKTIINAAANEKVPAKINGKIRKLTKKELAIRQLANKAIAGDLKAIEKLIGLLEVYGPQEDPGEISEEENAYNLETLMHLLKMSGLIISNEADAQEESDE